MSLPFAKIHGAGNDFVLVDDRDGRWAAAERADLIAALCARHTGVGADGMIFYRQPAATPQMVYYNADGAPSSFCGNGARCFVAFLRALGVVGEGRSFDFDANDGLHIGAALPHDRARVSMRIAGKVERLTATDDRVDTGSPHFIRWVAALPEGDITVPARAIRYGAAYAKTGINVNYVVDGGDDGLAIRTYERGVEDETLACGTGVTAAALSFAERRALTGAAEVRVRALGGELTVGFERSAEGVLADVWLEGPAEEVYRGAIDLERLSRARAAS